jgi:hypothetical protein
VDLIFCWFTELYRQQSPIDIITEHVVYDSTLKSAKLKIHYVIGDADTLEVSFKDFSHFVK